MKHSNFCYNFPPGLGSRAAFIDIDGCTHPHGVARRNSFGKIERAPNDGLFIWVELLVPILVEFPDLPLICHSHWRTFHTFEELKAVLPRILADRTVGMTSPNLPRHESIIECAKIAGFSQFVILDDDPWEFPRDVQNLVVVPSETGLSTPGAIKNLRDAIARMYA